MQKGQESGRNDLEGSLYSFPHLLPLQSGGLKMKMDEWKKTLEEVCEKKDMEIAHIDEDLKVALLEKEGDYWQFASGGSISRMDREAAEEIMEKQKAKEKEILDGYAEAGEPNEETRVTEGEGQEMTDSMDFEVEEFVGIPRQFMIRMGSGENKNVYVRREGLLYKAEQKGFRALTVEVEEIEGGYKAEAKLYPKIGKEIIEILKYAGNLDPEVQKSLLKDLIVPYRDVGTATTDNVKMKSMLSYRRELAATRASNRALRAFTACGFTSVEELSEYEGEVVEDIPEEEIAEEAVVEE